MRRLLSVEWIRVSRHWLTWALLAAWVVILMLQVNAKLNRVAEIEADLAVSPPAGERTPLEQTVLAGERLELTMLQDNLRYPTFIGYGVRLSTGLGSFLVILFTAVLGGEDFSRRTLRAVLARGVRRTDYLLARVLALWLAVGAAVVVIAALAATGGLAVHGRVTDDPIATDGLGDALLWALRAWLIYLPFIVATMFWVVLGRSAGPAMGVGFALRAYEMIGSLGIPFVAVLIAETDALGGGGIPLLFRWQVWLFDGMLGHNADIFLNWGIFYAGSPLFIVQAMGLGDLTLLSTSPWRATAFLAGYTVLFLGWAMWILHRRDVTYE